MFRINRKKADPEILQAYEELRFERRYPQLDLAINLFRAIAYAGVLPVLFIPADMRWTWMKVWMVIVSVALVVEFTLMIMWQPRNRRLKAAMFVLGCLALVLVMFAVYVFVMVTLFG